MKIHPCVLKQSKIICTPSDPGNFNLLSVALVFYKQMAEMQRVLLGSKGTEAAQVVSERFHGFWRLANIERRDLGSIALSLYGALHKIAGGSSPAEPAPPAHEWWNVYDERYDCAVSMRK